MVTDLLFIFLVILFTAVFKLSVALVASSPVLMADALHTFSDLLPYFALFLAAKAVNKKSDEKFPYGYYKLESLLTLIVSLLLAYTSIELFRFSSQTTTKRPLLATVVEILSSLVYLFVAKFQIALGERSRMKSVEVVGKEKIADALISIAAIPFFFIPESLSILQHAFVILISLFILQSAYEGLRDAIVSLLDINPSKELYSLIRSRVPEKAGIKLRKAGPCYFVEIYVKVDPSYSMAEFREIGEEIKSRLSDIDELCSVTVIPELERAPEIIAIPVTGEEISPSFSSAPEFLIFRGNEVERVKNPFVGKKVRRGAAVAEFLAGKGVNYVIAREIGSIAFDALKSRGILTYRGEGNAYEAVKKFLKGELEEIKAPTKVRL